MNTVFDIETGPETPERLSIVEPEFEAPGNFVDPIKIAGAKQKAREKWRADAALDPMTGRILAIGYRAGSESVIQAVDDRVTEEILIEVFFKTYMDRSPSTYFVGFNIHGFDLPFIVKRAMILGVWTPTVMKPNGTSRFYWPSDFVDLQQVWGCGELRPHGSLAVLARLIGLGEKTLSGADFARLYGDPATREQALNYLRNDLAITAKLAERLLA